jgi:histidine decarboxylase
VGKRTKNGDLELRSPEGRQSDTAKSSLELLGEEDEELKLLIAESQTERMELDERLLRLETALYYRGMLKKGIDIAEVLKYAEQDRQTLEKAVEYKSMFNGLHDTFFGYPGNLNADSPLVRHFRKEEAEMYYSNNCGDPYESSNSSMDGKPYEREILRLFYRKFGVDEEKGWGYITSGGSESNIWGIRNGFGKFPNGRLYFCEAAHYSVEKAVTNGGSKLYPYQIIPKTGGMTEKIDKEILLEAAKRNYYADGEPAILLLTWGTTKLGSVDDAAEITAELIRENIPYYLHIDAAFFGGIPNNQTDAPVCPPISELGADSISVSFHKFFGVPTINSIVISKDKASGKEISYLGTRDTTVLGSRTFPTFSAYQRIREILERSPSDYYIRKVRYFENKLKERGLKYYRDGRANIFVIPRPSDKILMKYQLPTFEGSNGKIDLAHIIVNPFHSEEELDRIFMDLAADQ